MTEAVHPASVWGGNTDHKRRPNDSATPRLGAAPYTGEQGEDNKSAWETPRLQRASKGTGRKYLGKGSGGGRPGRRKPDMHRVAAAFGSSPCMDPTAIAELSDSDTD